MQAVILAGGKGTRLKPFTNVIPKPLVPLGDKPILEIVLRQLKYYGVEEVIIAVNHLAQLIMAFFGNGESLGLKIRYSLEDKILGTAGPLRLIDGLDENFIVMNGDLLTTLGYDDLMKFHCSNGSEITISAFRKEVKIDLGVLKIENDEFVDYIEKPSYFYDVSMGIYVLNKRVLSYIPENEKFDMPDLILQLKDKNKKISCYRGNYDWLDIGRIEDYEKAVEIFDTNNNVYLPDVK